MNQMDRDPYGPPASRTSRIILFLLLWLVFSATLTVLTYYAAVAPIFRNRAVAVANGLVFGFFGTVGLLASLWGMDSEEP